MIMDSTALSSTVSSPPSFLKICGRWRQPVLVRRIHARGTAPAAIIEELRGKKFIPEGMSASRGLLGQRRRAGAVPLDFAEKVFGNSGTAAKWRQWSAATVRRRPPGSTSPVAGAAPGATVPASAAENSACDPRDRRGGQRLKALTNLAVMGPCNLRFLGGCACYVFQGPLNPEHPLALRATTSCSTVPTVVPETLTAT